MKRIFLSSVLILTSICAFAQGFNSKGGSHRGYNSPYIQQQQQPSSWSGSGIAIGTKLIATNHHVVDGATNLAIYFPDTDKEYRADLYTDPFLRGFLAELYNRPSCHQCKAREGRSGADITLADYWNVHRLFPEMDDDKGTSLVLVHTEKGRRLWASVASELMFCESTFADAVRNNPSIVASTKPNVRRAQFFRLLAKGRDFDWIVTRLLRRPLWRRCASKLKRVVLSMVKR